MTIDTYRRMSPGDAHCGPVALGNILGKHPFEIMKDWPISGGWTNHRKDTTFWDMWPIDTPWLHRKYIEEVLGLRMVPHDTQAPFPDNCVVLLHLHDQDDFLLKKLWDGLWNQHWVRVLHDNGHQVIVDWGYHNPSTKMFDRRFFVRMVNLMWPSCAYTIIGGGKE